MEVDRAVAASAHTSKGQARPATSTQSSVLRGYLMDSANRGGLAFPAGGVSFTFHLLATAATVGRGRDLAASLANVVGSFGPGRFAEMGRSLLGWQLCSCEKG